MTMYRFRLYVLGSSPRSDAAVEQLRSLCTARLGAAWDLQIVDVHEHAEQADAARIVATPTLDRLQPGPPVRVIGDLSAERLAAALGLPEEPHEPPTPPKAGGRA